MKLLTPREVAETLGISRITATRLMRTEMQTVNIAAGDVNEYLRVSEDELTAWYNRRARIQEAPAEPRKRGRPASSISLRRRA